MPKMLWRRGIGDKWITMDGETYKLSPSYFEGQAVGLRGNYYEY